MAKEDKILIRKLDKFIYHYYRTLALKGFIVFAIYFVVVTVLISVAQYFGHFSTSVRTVIFNGLLIFFIVLFFRYVLLPFLKMLKILKPISYEKAALIISTHFSEIKDRLLNTLELYRLGKHSPYSTDLLLASIEQRTKQLSPLPFSEAIDIKQIVRYLLIFFVLLTAIAILFVSKPLIYRQGTKPILLHSVYFETPAPFRFILLNDSLTSVSGNDFSVSVLIKGNYVPENVMINYAGTSFFMKKEKNNKFSYTFKSLNNNLSFYFLSESYKSRSYQITVFPSPVITDLTITITPPHYTGLSVEELQNIGNITIPEGSEVTWAIKSENIDTVNFTFNDSACIAEKKENALFFMSGKFFKPTNYQVGYQNKFVKKKNVFNYHIKTIPDLYPEISVKQFTDSLQPTLFYFFGNIRDDYGFTKMTFNYRTATDSTVTFPVEIRTHTLAQEFEYGFDFSNIISSNKEISYFFEIWDNDAIHGPKSSKSIVFHFSKPTKESLDSLENSINKLLEKKLKENKQLAENIQKNILKLKRDKITRNLTSWEKTKILQDIVQQQKQLQQNIEEIAKKNQQKNSKINTFSEQSQQLIEKQRQIEELLNNLMDEELKKMLEELAKLMDNAEEKSLDMQMDKMQMSYEEMKKQLDRNIELLKRFEVEKKIEQTIDDLQNLANRQEKLSQASKNKKNKTEELVKEAEKQKNDFEQIMEKYNEAKEKNKELEQPYILQDFQKEQENIQQEFAKGQKNLTENKRSKASQSQKKNAQSLSQMSQQMQQMMQQQMMQQYAEDLNNLKQIIDNLTHFSFEQENLMKQLKRTSFRDPKLGELIEKQRKLSESFSIIQDSLFALSKRIPAINQPIIKSLTNIEQWQEKVFNQIKTVNIRNAASTQQFIMTAANDLNLLLSELVQQMQNQMKQKSGNQMCQNPGSGMPKMGQMKAQMQSLKQQLQQMISQMKNKQSGKNQGKSNKEIGKTLAQYEKFRKSLQQLMNNNGSLTPDAIQKLNQINRLIQENINDLIDKNISENLVKRQDRIITRLLEAENSDYQRKTDKERKSREGRELPKKNTAKFFKQYENKYRFSELLNKTTIQLTPFYEKKYKEYLLNLEK
ncbi:MAG TPA: hypothetical protein EYP69_03595 [Bacteroidales bacterium]|nr:hypothetical protein [Bacteroidales bacterium]